MLYSSFLWNQKENIFEKDIFCSLDGYPSSSYGPPGYQPGTPIGNGNGNGNGNGGGNGNGNGHSNGNGNGYSNGNGNGNGYSNGNGNGNGNGYSNGNGNSNGINGVYGTPTNGNGTNNFIYILNLLLYQKLRFFHKIVQYYSIVGMFIIIFGDIRYESITSAENIRTKTDIFSDCRGNALMMIYLIFI